MYEYFALKKYLKSKSGVTFIELLIALVVMAALVAVGVPLYKNHVEKTKKTTCINNQKVLSDSLENAMTNDFIIEGNEYPDTIFKVGFVSNTESWGNGDISKVSNSVYFEHRVYYDKSTLEEVGEETILNGDWARLINNNNPLVDTQEKATAYLRDNFFDGQLPYCPTYTSLNKSNPSSNPSATYNGQSCYYVYSRIVVGLKFNPSLEVYITDVECANHGKTYHYSDTQN